jgi:hypothetical protein
LGSAGRLAAAIAAGRAAITFGENPHSNNNALAANTYFKMCFMSIIPNTRAE